MVGGDVSFGHEAADLVLDLKAQSGGKVVPRQARVHDLPPSLCMSYRLDSGV
jgi:hypothetical protein